MASDWGAVIGASSPGLSQDLCHFFFFFSGERLTFTFPWGHKESSMTEVAEDSHRLGGGPAVPLLMTSVQKKCVIPFWTGLCHGRGRGLHPVSSSKGQLPGPPQLLLGFTPPPAVHPEGGGTKEGASSRSVCIVLKRRVLIFFVCVLSSDREEHTV